MSQNLQLQKNLRSRTARIRHRRRMTTTNPRLASRQPGLSNFLTNQAIRANNTPQRLARPDSVFTIVSPDLGLRWKVGDKVFINGDGTGIPPAIGLVREVEERANDWLEYDGDNPIATETISIGADVYTYVAVIGVPDQPYDVLVGATVTDSINNLMAAINGSAGEGTLYGNGTPKSTIVTATLGPIVDSMYAYAIIPGDSQIGIPVDSSASATWWEGELINGQVYQVGLFDAGEFPLDPPGLDSDGDPYQLKNGRVVPDSFIMNAEEGSLPVSGVTAEELLDGIKSFGNFEAEPLLTKAVHFLDPRQTDQTYVDNGVPIN